jgi:hypothetical protein
VCSQSSRRTYAWSVIAKTKVEGVYKGRPASIDATNVREWKSQGLGTKEIIKALGIGRAGVYLQERRFVSPSYGPFRLGLGQSRFRHHGAADRKLQAAFRPFPALRTGGWNPA